MIYIFDTSSIIVFSHYFPSRFPKFWENLEIYTETGRIISVREVRRELASNATKDHLVDWLSHHKSIFQTPTSEESLFIRRIFENPLFLGLIKKKNTLISKPAADPFVIASAKVRGGTVVTEEKLKPNSAKIPSICKHFGVPCVDLEGFMAAEGWVF